MRQAANTPGIPGPPSDAPPADWPVAGSTSVGRLPTRMRGWRGLPSMPCVSSGSPKPGAAARHPLPLNTFL